MAAARRRWGATDNIRLGRNTVSLRGSRYAILIRAAITCPASQWIRPASGLSRSQTGLPLLSPRCRLPWRSIRRHHRVSVKMTARVQHHPKRRVRRDRNQNFGPHLSRIPPVGSTSLGTTEHLQEARVEPLVLLQSGRPVADPCLPGPLHARLSMDNRYGPSCQTLQSGPGTRRATIRSLASSAASSTAISSMLGGSNTQTL